MRSAIIILSLLLNGVIFAQNQTPIESEAEESIDEIQIQTAPSVAKEKAAKPYTRKREQKTVAKDSQLQKFKSYKSSASVQRSQRTPSSIQQSQMDAVVSSLESNSPNSFEYHYFKYVAGNYDASLVEHLNAAEKLRPNNADVIAQKVAYFIITGNAMEKKTYLNKLFSSNKLSKNATLYATDILLSVPKNGTLITHGFDDTYGAFYKQAKGIRSDVQIISLDLLQSEAYRIQLKKKGYKMPSSKVVNTQFLSDFCKMNHSKNLAVSLTTPKEYLKPISKQLYLQGLVMVYSNYAKENFKQNDFLWHSKLKKELIAKATDEKAKQLSANYLPMLLILRKGYNSSGEYRKIEEIDKVIDAISIQCNKYDKVQQLKGSY